MEDIPLDIDDRPTVRSIAVGAGVSASTVSRALKGDPRISRETGDRIMAVVQEQGYTPNVIARSLVTRSSGVIGIVLG